MRNAMPLANPKPPEVISFKAFLEGTPTATTRLVKELWEKFVSHQLGQGYRLCCPPLLLYCAKCEGPRNFRSDMHITLKIKEEQNLFLIYLCGDCNQAFKVYPLSVIPDSMVGIGSVMKFGEHPANNPPISKRLLRLFGKDSRVFLNGRSCENLGYGVGAFAYYRRVVENHKNDLFDEIIKYCKTQPSESALVQELEEAKAEISFEKAIQRIRHGVPQALLLSGGINPLTALHGALSVGIHELSDEECLQMAANVRTVLTTMVETMAMLMRQEKEVAAAAQALIAAKSKKPPSPAPGPKAPDSVAVPKVPGD